MEEYIMRTISVNREAPAKVKSQIPERPDPPPPSGPGKPRPPRPKPVSKPK